MEKVEVEVLVYTKIIHQVCRHVSLHIDLCRPASPSLSISLDVVQEPPEGVKGRGLGEEFAPRETPQLKLGLGIVNPVSPQLSLKKTCALPQCLTLVLTNCVTHRRVNTLLHEGSLTHI